MLCLQTWTDPEDQAHKTEHAHALETSTPNSLDLRERHFCRGKMRGLEQTALNLYFPTVATGVATCADFAMPFVSPTVRPLVNGKPNPHK